MASSWRRADASRVTDKSCTWHIDPLDATTNFLHAIPLFAISIALEREGQIVGGVVDASDEMYVAEKGQGAFGGNRRLRVAGRSDLSQALFGCGIPHLGKAAQHPRLMAELKAVMAPHRQCAADGLRRARPRLRRRRPVRRLLGARPQFLGHCGRRAPGSRSRRLRATGADGEANFLETGSICCGNEIMHRELLALLRGVA